MIGNRDKYTRIYNIKLMSNIVIVIIIIIIIIIIQQLMSLIILINKTIIYK